MICDFFDVTLAKFISNLAFVGIDSLYIGSPQLRYSHEACGHIRGVLPLNDACCSDVSRDGQHSMFFCVPSQIFQCLPSSTVNQLATAAGDPGFVFKDDCKRITFPCGPTTLIANEIVGALKDQSVNCEAAYWTFEMSGNRHVFCI